MLVNAGTPQNVVVNLPSDGRDDQTVLQAVGASGQVTISSQDGAFETTTFAGPNSLTINLTGLAGQTITVGPLTSDIPPFITLNGGSAPDTFNLQSKPVGFIVVNGGSSGASVLNYDVQTRYVGTFTGALAIQNAFAANVTYTGIGVLNLNNASGVDTLYGPDTADRATAFTGLTAQERFVQRSTWMRWAGPGPRPSWTAGLRCSARTGRARRRPRRPSRPTSNTARRGGTAWSRAGTSPSWAGRRWAARSRPG